MGIFETLDSLLQIEAFGKAFIPKRFRPGLRKYFMKAGINEVPYRTFGLIFYAALLITFFIYSWKVYPALKGFSIIMVFIIAGTAWAVLSLLFSVALALAYYFYLDLIIYNRTKKMEDVLPDFLRFVSENLKGGMSFEKALWTSIKPEFNVLGSEVRLAAKKVMTGMDVEDALRELTDKYDSPIVKRAFNLIVEGMKGGGTIAELIDRVIEDIEEMKELKAEMRATNLTYIIFVTFVVIIVAPGLFTLSFQFLIVLQNLGTKLGGQSSGAGAPQAIISFGKVAIDPEVFKEFSLMALGCIAGFSAIIVSIISKGNIKGGIRLIPIYAISAIIVYKIMMYGATSIFSQLF